VAGVGPPPKPNAVRRNKVDTSHLEVEHYVPDRLKKLAKRSTYSAATLMWWDTWAHSEQARFFSPTDWLRLQMLAPLVEAYFRRPGHNALAEIRQNESLLGATIVDRMRLRMRIGEEVEHETIEAEIIREEDDELYRELGGM